MRDKIQTLDREVINQIKTEFIAIDLETTGSDPKKDAILEVGAVRFRNLAPQDRYSFLVYTDKPIPQKITELTGIRAEHLQGAWQQDAVPVALAYTFPGWHKQILCAHRADFDFSFLDQYVKYPLHYVDTMELAQKARLDVMNYKLDSVAEYYNIPTGRRHRALADAETAGQILVRLVKRADKALKFQEELEELLQ